MGCQVAESLGVPAAPGAADAGSGVAAILESARAFRSGPAPRNDVILLFTDGEELGLLGARAFVEQHPWAKDVRVAVNFEARGTSGPAQMFETGPDNGAVVAGANVTVTNALTVNRSGRVEIAVGSQSAGMEILNQNLKVMDSTAVSLCMDNNMPIIVFNLLKEGNIKRVITGEKIGTAVKG